MKAEWYKADGTILEVVPANSHDFVLDELQGFVGGYIEIIQLNESQIMVLNEEGKLKRLPMNENATLLALHAGFYDTIVGDVLVCDTEMVQ